MGILASMPTTDSATPVPDGRSLARSEEGALAELLVVLADQDLAGYSPVYDRIARALAEDEQSLRLVVGVVPVTRSAVLLFAVTHDIVLAEPDSDLAAVYRGDSDADPWPGFRSLLHDRADAIRARMERRSVQTNEVGRSAALLPALATIAAHQRRAGDPRRLALLEVGPSAGLNLFIDRFVVDYVDAAGASVVRSGPDASPVHLTCELRGPGRPVLPPPTLDIARREGIDPSPIDVTDADACRWLEACIWPGQPGRAERLRAAISVARSEPPTLVTGDARTDLAPLLDRIPDDVLPVVVSTWALAYLDRQGRLDVCAVIDDHGTRRDLAFVTAESPHVTPWVRDPLTGDTEAPGEGTPTLLGLRRWTGGQVESIGLARMHPHARWLQWNPRVTA